jgi:outer membrane receptor protein involved in Fe transport
LASFTATYFSRRVHSLIVPVPCQVSPSCLFGSLAGNAGRVDTQGIELEPSLRPWRDFRLSGNFTFLDETHRSSSPTIRPERVPKHAAAAIAQYEHTDMLRYGDKVNASLVYTFIGDRDDVDQTGAIRSHVGYHVFDAVLSYAAGITLGAVRDEEFYVRVQNLFDRNYSQNFGFKSPPINFVAGVKLDFGAAPAAPVK